MDPAMIPSRRTNYKLPAQGLSSPSANPQESAEIQMNLFCISQLKSTLRLASYRKSTCPLDR